MVHLQNNLTTQTTMRRSNKKRGHTLVEAMFAVFLALTCALIFGATMPMASTSRAKADMRTTAAGLAQKQLEAIKAGGYANVTAQRMHANGLIDSLAPVVGTTYSFTNADSAATDSPAQVLPGGQGTVTIDQLDLELRQVIVEVTYLDRGEARSFRIGTLVANL